MDWESIVKQMSEWVVTDGLRILLILILMFVFIKIAQLLTDRLFKRFKKGKREVDYEFKNDILEPIEILGLDQFADSAIVIKARTKTKPIRQWAVGREFNRRMKKRFDEKDIEIPFPHVTLYMGQDKDGQAAPMHVNMQGK